MITQRSRVLQFFDDTGDAIAFLAGVSMRESECVVIRIEQSRSSKEVFDRENEVINSTMSKNDHPKKNKKKLKSPRSLNASRHKIRQALIEYQNHFSCLDFSIVLDNEVDDPESEWESKIWYNDGRVIKEKNSKTTASKIVSIDDFLDECIRKNKNEVQSTNLSMIAEELREEEYVRNFRDPIPSDFEDPDSPHLLEKVLSERKVSVQREKNEHSEMIHDKKMEFIMSMLREMYGLRKFNNLSKDPYEAIIGFILDKYGWPDEEVFEDYHQMLGDLEG